MADPDEEECMGQSNERQAQEAAHCSLLGVQKQETAQCHPTWSKDECQEAMLGLSHRTTGHSNISICPCSHLRLLRRDCCSDVWFVVAQENSNT